MHPRMPLGASAWVERFAAGVEPGSQVLDVACGGGRHFPLFLARGCQIIGVDRDLSEAQRRWGDTTSVQLIQADLETGQPPPFQGQRFAAVVVTNYLWRPLLDEIISAVGPAGLLVYETFMRGNERYGRPSNPEFLLEPQELLRAVRGKLAVVAFEQVHLTDPNRLVQRIAAVGPHHGWDVNDAPAA